MRGVSHLLPRTARAGAICGLLIACNAAPAHAAIVAVTGTGAPPSSLGGFALTDWPAEARGLGTTTTTVATNTGTATLDRSVLIRQIGVTWLTAPWGGVFDGRMYATPEGPGPAVTITLPEPANAIRFQAEPDACGPVDMQVTAQDGSSAGPATVWVCSGGAEEGTTFGFYATGGSKISALTLTSETSGNDVAFGNFASNEGAADGTPPEITPHVSGTAGDDGWYTGDAHVSFTVDDPDSAVSATTGCDDADVTHDTTGTTFTCTATSAGGTNSASVTVKRDATAPTVTLDCPDALDLGRLGTATWTASDAASGLAGAASGVVAIPASAAAGSVTVTVPAGATTDRAGNASAEQTCTTHVLFAVNGFFAPIRMDTVNVVRAGSAVPLKFAVGGVVAGTSPVDQITTAPVACDGDAGAGRALQPGEATAAWQYVWKTSAAWAGTCRRLTVAFTDGTTLGATFLLR